MLMLSVRRLALAVVACVALGAGGAVAGSTEDAAALVDEGKVLYRAHDFGGAFAKFRAAADKDPKHPTALYNAALAARKGGLLDDARGAYRDLLQRAPDDLDAVYGLAEVERALAHDADARVLYERYVRDEKRPERKELVERSQAALAALPPPAAPRPTPVIERPAASAPANENEAAKVAARAAAQKAFEEGVALQKLERFEPAAERFWTAAEKDPTRVDALLKAGVTLRKATRLDASKEAYEKALATSTATPENQWDATYGLAETERLRGEKRHAAELFESYASMEKRASEERYVKRAIEVAAALRAELASAAAALAAIVPPVSAPVIAPPVMAPPVMAPPVVIPPVMAPPVIAAPAASSVAAPATTVAAPTPTAVAPSTVAPPKVVAAPAVAAVAGADVDFFGDAVAVDGLVADARAAEAAGATERAAALWARVASLAPGDARLPASSAPVEACDVDRLLARGEVALANHNAADAIVAFRRARLCDATRAAPLWGLSRAFDAVGARKQGRHHASLYARSAAPDRDPTSAGQASWRAEQPD